MLKVMIVDDMDITRREIKRLKIWGEITGFAIAAEAKNGQEALEILETDSVDLVITDIKMPKVDGLELLKKIMEKGLCPCVVLLSDYTDFRYARQGLVLGAFDYMAKPVVEEELFGLLQRVKEVIGDKNKERERVKKLEEKLEEKVEVFFPTSDVRQLLELIKEGDNKSLEVAARIVDLTAANLNDDLFKIESVLKKVLLETIKNVMENKKWLHRFVNTTQLENTQCLQCEDYVRIKEAFIQKIGAICILISKLQCGRQGNDIVSQVCNCVLESVDGELSLKTVADKLFMNKTYVSEAFKQKAGISFVEYLTVVKMERAKKLLQDGNLKTYEVGEILGFKDSEYFSKLFKKYSGLPPSEFRQT